MLRFEEKHGSIFCIDERDNIQYEVTEPAVMFTKDEEFCVLHKIGNKSDIEPHFDKFFNRSQLAGGIFGEWYLIDLPKDAVLLDKLLQNTSFLETWLKEEGLYNKL